MSTFYLLPPRSLFGERIAAFLNLMFPGLEWPSPGWSDLAHLLGDLAAQQPNVYVIYGEDLPAGEDCGRTLADIFGAADGDLVVEVCADENAYGFSTRRWQVGMPDARAA